MSYLLTDLTNTTTHNTQHQNLIYLMKMGSFSKHLHQGIRDVNNIIIHNSPCTGKTQLKSVPNVHLKCFLPGFMVR